MNSLDSTSIAEPCPKGPKGEQKRPHGILFRATLALDSGQTLDGGWRHNSNALAGEKWRLVYLYLRLYQFHIRILGCVVVVYERFNSTKLS